MASRMASSAVSERRVDHVERFLFRFFLEEPKLGWAVFRTRFSYQLRPPSFLVAPFTEELDEALLDFFTVEEDAVVAGELAELNSSPENVIEFKTLDAAALNAASAKFFDERRPDFLTAPFTLIVYVTSIDLLPDPHLRADRLTVPFAPLALVFTTFRAKRIFGNLNVHGDTHVRQNRFGSGCF